MSLTVVPLDLADDGTLARLVTLQRRGFVPTEQKTVPGDVEWVRMERS